METKPQIRAVIRAERLARQRTPESGSRDGFAAQLAELVTERGARRVSCFVSANGEPDTSGFFAWALEHDIEVFLPRVTSATSMEWVRLTRDPLLPGAFGIPEPTGPAVEPDAVSTLDLMFIPAAAVDRAGTRLGWGRGYFDRELAAIQRTTSHTPQLFAVVFENEIVDRLPVEPHDIPVSGAVSEAATHRFG